ncbi:MAG TPA: DUF4383 domain-containing protein [Solirubrobacteraceae bacterium]|nr:DUF4383 domain-containing protein [Solirubrobacteraceae bacterium]
MGTSLAARVAVVVGLVYVALGIGGFAITGWDTHWTVNTNDDLLGIGLNPFHNIVHVGIGALLLIMGVQKNTPAAEGALMGGGLTYIVVFVIGVTASDNLTILSIDGPGDVGNFFHLVSGVVALAVGLLSSAATASQMKKRGIA